MPATNDDADVVTSFEQPQVGRIVVVNNEPRWYVPTDAVTPDPNNLNDHDEISLGVIGGSLKRFGQQKPIVIDDKFVIVAGNGLHAEAVELGLAEIWVTRTALVPTEAAAFGFADNQSARYSRFKADPTADYLRMIRDSGDSMTGLGATDDDILKFLRVEADNTAKSNKTTMVNSAQLGGFQYRVVIECETEKDQLELLERLEFEGYKCQALIS